MAESFDFLLDLCMDFLFFSFEALHACISSFALREENPGFFVLYFLIDSLLLLVMAEHSVVLPSQIDLCHRTETILEMAFENILSQ